MHNNIERDTVFWEVDVQKIVKSLIIQVTGD